MPGCTRPSARAGIRSRRQFARSVSLTAFQCRERSRIGAVVSEQYLQQIDISGLDQMNIETSFEARVADVRIGISGERDQIELRGGEPLTQTTSELNAVHPRQ